MEDKFRSVLVQKTRYGVADWEDNLYYDGKCNKWVELPNSESILDFEMFEDPNWYNKEQKSVEKVEDTKKLTKFTL